MRVFEQLLAPLRRPVVTSPYPAEAPALQRRGTRGTPCYVSERCNDDGVCVTVCPVRAIRFEGAATGRRWSLDYGACLFCGECIRRCPDGAIVPSTSFELAVRSRKDAIATSSRKGSGSDG